MKVKCSRASCLYEWDYNGKAKWYASCPRCHSSVNLRKFVYQNPVTKHVPAL